MLQTQANLEYEYIFPSVRTSGQMPAEGGDVLVGAQQTLQRHQLAPVQRPQQRADLMQQRAEWTKHVRHLFCAYRKTDYLNKDIDFVFQ